jgi:hypothetical protein
MLLALVLATATGCDQGSDGNPSLAVVVTDGSGAPVEGLSVAVHPCRLGADGRPACGSVAGRAAMAGSTTAPAGDGEVTVGMGTASSVWIYPTPVAAQANVTLAFREAADVAVEANGMDGAPVASLFDGTMNANQVRRVVWSPDADTPDGVYALRLRASNDEVDLDSTHVVLLARPAPVFRTLGTTGADGRVQTTEMGSFPGRLGLPAFDVRDDMNTYLGTTRIGSEVTFRLTDPTTGTTRTVTRSVGRSTSRVELVW